MKDKGQPGSSLADDTRPVGEAYDQARAQLIQDIEAARRQVVIAKKEPPKTLF